MSAPPARSRLDIWEQRQQSAIRALPYASLAVSLMLSTIIRQELDLSFYVEIGLTGLSAAWMLWMVDLHPAWTAYPRRMEIFFVGLVALIAALTLYASWFGFFTLGGYIFANRVLRGARRFIGMALVAIIAATAQNGGLPANSASAIAAYLVYIVINVCVAELFGVFGMTVFAQRERSREMVATLAEANGRLESSLRENAGLQAQLLAQAREAGIQDERGRMAREIHDTLAQGFTGVIAQLEAAKRADDKPELRRRHVDQAQRLARESLVEARRSVRALQPQALEAARLPDALADLARRWSQLTAVATTYETTGEPRSLQAEIDVTLLRVAQEALHNVAKHARATRVGLTLSYMDDVVLLDVRDDGAGFDAATIRGNGRAAEQSGFGLAAMGQRLRQVAGSLAIESAPGAGTAINATVPALPAGGGG